MYRFKTEDIDVFNIMIAAAIEKGLHFNASYNNTYYIIEYTGGF